MNDRFGKKLQEMRINEVLPHVEGKLLDIGCGANLLTKKYIAKSKQSAVGVDVHDWGNVDLIVEDTSKLPFNANEFETVSIIAALNHIPNRTAVLKEANRVLKNNGRLILTMLPPKLSYLWHKVREPWDDDQHERGMAEGEVYGITRQDMIQLAENAGFTLVKDYAFMMKLNRMYIFKRNN